MLRIFTLCADMYQHHCECARFLTEVESSDHDWKDGSATGSRYVLGQEDKGSSGNIEDRMV